MVTVVGDLIVHLPRLRIHLVKPLESPVDLVHDVRDPVASRSSVRKMIVRERLRVALVSEHHLVDGVRRGGCVLKAVRRVVPSSGHVKERAVLPGIRMPDNDAVLPVAAVLEERIPSATLLTHVVQHEISRAVVHTSPHREGLRAGLAARGQHLDVISAAGLQSAEIQAAGCLHAPQDTSRSHGGGTESHLAGESVNQLKTIDLRSLITHEHRHFRRFRKVADLVDTDP